MVYVAKDHVRLAVEDVLQGLLRCRDFVDVVFGAGHFKLRAVQTVGL